MAKFNFIKTEIEDVFIIESEVYEDDRGFYMGIYNKEEFENGGISVDFFEDNHSKSKKGVLRGLHFQYTKPQGKLARVIKGKVFDVAVDLRKDSKTYGDYVSVILSEDDNRQFYIPEGFAHGFLALENNTEFVYKCTNIHDSEDEGGVAWNDNTINIQWPLEYVDQVILSQKDRNWGELMDKLIEL